MDNLQKQNNFLEAIRKYAKEQKQQMIEEVESFKALELKKAEEEGVRDADLLIQREIEHNRAKITADFAKKEHESLTAIYARRQEIQAEIFSKAAERLCEYTFTDEYNDDLIESAKKMAELFGENASELFVCQKDFEKQKSLVSPFAGNVVVTVDENIKIGGIKGICATLNIVADETLDTKLSEQIDWFVMNSKLEIKI